MHSDSQQCVIVASCSVTLTALTQVRILPGTRMEFNDLPGFRPELHLGKKDFVSPGTSPCCISAARIHTRPCRRCHIGRESSPSPRGDNSGEGTGSTGLYVDGASPTVPSTNLLPSGIDSPQRTRFPRGTYRPRFNANLKGFSLRFNCRKFPYSC